MQPALSLRALTAGGLLLSLLGTPLQAQTPQKLDKVRFGTNWLDEVEHGGIFLALADGSYKSYGLDVTIVPGGPNVNNRIMLLSKKLDFDIAANNLQSLDAVANKVPVVAVAAIFQKDPQVLIALPESRVSTLDDL